MVKRLSPITVQDAYNVTAYGAKGDGSTNDTSAIQATIDAAYGAGGGVVYLPAGTYIVNPGIQVKSNVTFRGSGGGTILKLVASSTTDDNILKSESYDNVTIEELVVDGNRTNQGGTPGSYTHTQYGIYIAGSGKVTVRNVGVKSTTGVGIHIYNASATTVENCYSTDNNYHGFEVEQCVGSKFGNIYGFDNLLHGLLVSPGEVSGTGSKYNHFVNCHFDSNDQYGIAFNAANSDVSPWLSEANQFTNCSATNNGQYGVNIYKQDRQIFTNLVVEYNGYHGIYCYQSADNIWNNLQVKNNSQTTNNTYDEILLEGASGGHASSGNLFSSVKTITEGTNKARYALHESAAGDSNVWLEVSILGTPATANTSISTSSRYGHVDLTSDQSAIGGNKIFTTGFGVAANSVTPSAALAGLDAPFGSTSPGRIFSKYGMQLVTSNGAFDIYVSDGTTQNNIATFYNDHLDMRAFKITDMADPTSAQDAATKAYADTKATGAASSADNAIVRFDGATGKVVQNSLVTVNDTGDISTGGNLLIGGNGSSSTSGNGTITITSSFGASATIQATGGSANLSVNKALDMGSHKVTSVTDPTSAQDAATKNYADTATTIYHPGGTDVAVADGGTGVSTITGIVKGNGTSAMTAATAGTDYLAPTSTIQTRINPRTNTVTSSATPSINTDTTDEFTITALAAAITSMTTNLSGTPVNGQELMIRFKDNGTGRAITWGASFVSSGVATLLATTVANKTHYVKLRYDSTAAVWVCLAVDATGY